MANEQILSIGGFKSGLITRVPSTAIPDDAFSDVQNIELDEKYLPTKAKGHSKYNSASLGANSTRGGFVYTMTDGTKYYVVACGGKLYYSIAGSGEFTAYQIGGNDITFVIDSDVEIVQYLNSLWIINGKYPVITNGGYLTTRLLKINGTTASALTDANIPQGGKYIIVHQERLFIAGSIDQPNGFYWSEPYDPTDWIPEYGLNYDFVGKDDGENITGLKSYQGYVYVGKPHNLYRYATQGDITQWSSQRVDTKLGWLYHRTIQEFFGLLVYLSPEGVAQFSGNDAQLISEQIKDKILALPQLKVDTEKQWLITTTDDFNAGNVPTVCNTADSEIKEKKIIATLQNWEQTAQADFEAGTITNLATQGAAEGTIQLPTSKIDTIDADFNAGEIKQNVAIANNELKRNISLIDRPRFFGSSSSWDGGGNPSAATDGNDATAWWGGTFISGNLWWKWLNTPSVYFTPVSIRVKGVAIPDHKDYGSNGGVTVSVRIINVNDTETEIWSVAYVGNNSYNYFDHTISYSASQIKGVIVHFIRHNDNHRIGGGLYTVSVNFNGYDWTSPSVFVSREHDTLCKENNFNWSTFIANHNIPVNTFLNYEIGTYDTPGTAWASIPYKQTITSGSTPTIAKRRYVKWKATLTNSSNNIDESPIVYDVTQNFATTGSWISPKRQLGRVDTFKEFLSSYTKNSQTLNLYYRTARTSVGLDTATWYLTDNNSIPTNALLGADIWIQIKAEFSTTNGTVTPVLNDIKAQYYTLSTPLTLDYTANLPTTLGNLAAQTSGTITFQTKTSATDLTDDQWYETGGWTNVIGGVVGSAIGRYMRIKSNLSAGATLQAIWLGCEYRSIKKDLGLTPGSWGLFESAYDTAGQTLTFWMRAASTPNGLDTATWYQQTPGNLIDSVPFGRFIQIEIRINATVYTQQPKVDSVLIKYYTGIKYLQPCSVVWKNNYWLNMAEEPSTINNIVYQFNKNGYWLKRTNKKNNVYIADGDKLFSGTSENDGYVRQNDIGLLDDQTQIESYFETKKFELASMTKCFKHLLFNSKSDSPFSLGYSVDESEYNNMFCYASAFVSTIKKVLAGLVTGRYIKFKIIHSLEDDNFEFHWLNLLWTPIRELNVETGLNLGDYWGYGYFGEEDSSESPYYGGAVGG